VGLAGRASRPPAQHGKGCGCSVKRAACPGPSPDCEGLDDRALWIKIGAIAAPRGLRVGAIDIQQPRGRHPQRPHLADAHQDAPRYQLDALGWKMADVAVLLQALVEFTQGLPTRRVLLESASTIAPARPASQ